MKEIPLTQGKVALVDDADYEAVMQFKWYAKYYRSGGAWYAARNIRNPDGTKKTQLLHQFLLPSAPRVDHKDGNSLNDQRYNLRPCTHAQNMHNRRKNLRGTSSFKGVRRHSRNKKWEANIKINGKRHYLGLFYTEEDAARAYDSAARKFQGEFARVNFPE